MVAHSIKLDAWSFSIKLNTPSKAATFLYQVEFMNLPKCKTEVKSRAFMYMVDLAGQVRNVSFNFMLEIDFGHFAPYK